MTSSTVTLLLLAAFSTLASATSTCTAFNSTHYATCTTSTSRTYLVHRPASYSDSSAHALVLSYHGRGGTPDNQATITGLSAQGILIGGKGIVAVYPAGLNEAWQGAPYASTSADDIQFTLDMITDVSAANNIDSSRIYASGKSNGGGFVNLLACTSSTASLIAAFAPVSPALYSGTLSFENCNPGRFLPIINSHGTSDQTIPFLGRVDNTTGSATSGNATPDIYTWRGHWASHNGCTSPAGSNLRKRGKKVAATLSTTVGNPTGVEQPFANTLAYTYDCQYAEVQGVTVAGLGHSWPTVAGLDTPTRANSTASFDFTTAFMIPFFEKHSLQ